MIGGYGLSIRQSFHGPINESELDWSLADVKHKRNENGHNLFTYDINLRIIYNTLFKYNDDSVLSS